MRWTIIICGLWTAHHIWCGVAAMPVQPKPRYVAKQIPGHLEVSPGSDYQASNRSPLHMVRRPGHRDLPKSVKAAMKNEPSMIEDADHTYVKVLERNWRYQPTSIMRTRVSRKGAASEAVLIVKRGKGMTVFRVQSPRPIGPMGSPVEVKEISGYGDPGSFRGMMVDGRSTTLEPEAAFNALSAVPRYPYYETVEPKAELARLASVMEGLRVAYLRDQAAERGAVERT